MAHLVVRNLGPIVEADLDLARVNVFMGPQSSGKSTIVKVLSICRWLEKQYLLYPNAIASANIRKLLIDFHRFDEKYFQKETLIDYVSDIISIRYTEAGNSEISSKLDVAELRFEFLSKLAYIPAERNLAAAIPNIIKYADGRDNLISFLFDWFDARQQFRESNRMGVLNLGASYHFNKDSETDMVTLANGVQLPLKTTSSGLQSVIPLQLLLDYSCCFLYDHPQALSYKMVDLIRERIKSLQGISENAEKEIRYLEQVIAGEKNIYRYTQLFIEEPEQNLYPETQKEFIDTLIKALHYDGFKHRAAITTHSPYILYALNNSMMYHLVGSKLDTETKERLGNLTAIDPNEVLICEIDKGYVRRIQGEDGLISANYFDGIMQGIMDDFYTLLEYYGK